MPARNCFGCGQGFYSENHCFFRCRACEHFDAKYYDYLIQKRWDECNKEVEHMNNNNRADGQPYDEADKEAARKHCNDFIASIPGMSRQHFSICYDRVARAKSLFEK